MLPQGNVSSNGGGALSLIGGRCRVDHNPSRPLSVQTIMAIFSTDVFVPNFPFFRVFRGSSFL